MRSLSFTIATQEKVVYQDDVFQVRIPTTLGEITVLPGHIPLVSALQSGELQIKDKDGDHAFAISGGCVEIKEGDDIVILAHNIERAADIDIARAEEAKKRAKEMLESNKHEENVDFARLQALIDREFNRIRVGNKYRK